ncbi:MAG: 1-deoxy-D-xylulose-5-phosphate reductoisomerase [Bacteroidetes bacterium]|nr:MAG: 1-deoxy-D-xylulose-5-phosphate reductoisomerase [Bacteroidota bacterium]
MRKQIAILGSTGSIGTKTLDVVRNHNEHFGVEVLTAFNNADLLINQAVEHKPNVVVIGNDEHYTKVFDALDPLDIKVYAGSKAIEQVLEMESIEQVVLGIGGFSGLAPLLSALRNKKRVALANKESLVVAGELVSKTALENSTPIIPVDSEHSAIFQCLMGEGNNPIDKIVLTASGGPFRGMSEKMLEQVKPSDALKHPVWKMGNKVTIDSATLMNKGLEAIEAHWLFNVSPSKIEVIIHPQAIIHSMVYFADGIVKAQLGTPDMFVPIQFALSYPDRLPNKLPPLDLLQLKQLDFEAPDIKNFRNLALAFEALEKGGNMPCILNAANEIAVQAFLTERIGFNQIPEVIEKSMQTSTFIQKPTLEDYIETDRETREKVEKSLKKSE